MHEKQPQYKLRRNVFSLTFNLLKYSTKIVRNMQNKQSMQQYDHNTVLPSELCTPSASSLICSSNRSIFCMSSAIICASSYNMNNNQQFYICWFNVCMGQMAPPLFPFCISLYQAHQAPLIQSNYFHVLCTQSPHAYFSSNSTSPTRNFHPLISKYLLTTTVISQSQKVILNDDSGTKG